MDRSLPPFSSADPATVLRAVLERRHLGPDVELEVLGEPPAQVVRFQELVEASRLEPQTLRQSLVNLLGGIHSAGLTLFMWVHSNGESYRIFFGVNQSDGEARPHVDGILRKALEGHLLGSRFKALVVGEEGVAPIGSLTSGEACGVVLGIPGDRDENPENNSLDGALEALAGTRFDLLLRCLPVGPGELDVAEANLALVSGQAHALGRHSVSASDARSFSKAMSAGFSLAKGSTETTNWSTTRTEGTTETTQGPGEQAVVTAASSILGTVIGGLAGFVAGGPVGAAYGASIGGSGFGQMGNAYARMKYPDKHRQDSVSESEQTGSSTSETRTESRGTSETTGRQVSEQLSLEVVNRQAQLLEEMAESHLERIRVGRSLGMWRLSASIVTRTRADLDVTAGLLTGTLRGDSTHLEQLRLVPYSAGSSALAIRSLAGMSPPELGGAPHPLIPRAEQPETILTSPELSRWMPIPSHDLPGIPVRSAVHLGRGAARSRTATDTPGQRLELGRLVYGGRPSPSEKVWVESRDLTGHVFVAGTTGSGKTTTIKTILRWLQSQKPRIPFLLLEPAKSEYLDLFEELKRDGRRPVRFQVGLPPESEDERPLRFNPFAAPIGLPLGRHVEALKVLLRSCFEMQESLPQLLEQLLFETYADLGWKDLVTPVSDHQVATQAFPTFDSFFQKVPSARIIPVTRIERTVKAFEYEERIERNLVAALTVRLDSFRRGLKGAVFGGDGLDRDVLLNRPCFINVADVNEPDIRRFLLASLFLRIYAEREAAKRQGESGPVALSHMVVLEEAHHFLLEGHGDAPGADLVRQSNAVMANAFSELRSFGQSILVADQAPGDLAAAVIRNTNVKLVHRLFQEQDVVAMSQAIGLPEDSRGELRRLLPGECVVFSPALQQPVLCRIDSKSRLTT